MDWPPRRRGAGRARRELWDARHLHVLLAAAARMACHTRSGVAGISIWWTPSSARASTIALITAANAGVVPPSPPERTPRRFEGDGTSLSAVFKGGKVSARGIA